MQLNPQWNSGTPYNITTGTDLNGDGSINDRPLGFARNTGKGPSNYSMNGSISKTFFLHRPAAQQGNNFADLFANSFAEPQRGGGGGGGGGFGGNGGNQGGGGRNNN